MGELITLLIADDEYLVRKGIRCLLKDQSEYAVVAEAVDGQEALQKASELQPQIIILDVKMPRMDGLTALEEIRKVSPNSKTIILSGYSSFEYARRALKLGACDYLLKPVAKEELFEVLRRLKFRIVQEEQQLESSKQMEQRLEFSMSAFLEQFYLQLLHSELSEEEIIEKMQALEMENQGASVMLVGLDHSYRLQTFNQGTAYSTILQNLRSVLGDILENGRPNAPPVLDLSNGIFALIYFDSFSPQPLEFARMVLRTVKGKLEHTVSVALSGSHPLSDLGKAYEEAGVRLKQRLLLGGDRVIFQDMEHSAALEQYPYELERKLSASIRFGDSEQMKSVLRQMLRQIEKQGIPYDRWQQIAFEILDQAYQIGREMGLSAFTAIQLVEKSREISLLTTSLDIQLWLERILGDLAGQIQTLGMGPSLAVKKALSFIEGHFQQSIKLNDVAKHVFLSPNYLTQQLKKQTGKSFHQHLGECRLREAKRLLRTSLLAISEVADRVGYENPRYFSKVFRRQFGRTPSSFRKASAT